MRFSIQLPLATSDARIESPRPSERFDVSVYSTRGQAAGIELVPGGVPGSDRQNAHKFR